MYTSKMLSVPFLLSLVYLLQVDVAEAMDCSLGTSSNFIQEVINSCPLPLESSDKSFCCYNIEKEHHYCCDVEEFAIKMGLGITLPIVIVAGIVISIIVCCISCLCCSCCPCYRRRHQGTVYGKVQTPGVIHVIQTSANVAAGPPTQSQEQYISPPPYSTNMTGMTQPAPQYSNVPYAKQAPYNPNFNP